jgi:hypothetical protein
LSLEKDHAAAWSFFVQQRHYKCQKKPIQSGIFAGVWESDKKMLVFAGINKDKTFGIRSFFICHNPLNQ